MTSDMQTKNSSENRERIDKVEIESSPLPEIAVET
jgi:hypothetical protein